MRKGLFITFEGPEGSGKSTQIVRLVAYLKKRRCACLVLREPGGTRISEAIRNILLDGRHKKMVPETELLLYLAARSQITREKILPALKQGKIVICDRFEDSTLAYQGYGRGLSIEAIRKISRMARGGLVPDITFLLDLPPGKGFARIGRRDRMEKASLLFHKRVRQGFLKLARAEKRRFTVLDATQERQDISEQIQRRLKRVLKRA